jgi:hypothetical protein
VVVPPARTPTTGFPWATFFADWGDGKSHEITKKQVIVRKKTQKSGMRFILVVPKESKNKKTRRHNAFGYKKLGAPRLNSKPSKIQNVSG